MIAFFSTSVIPGRIRLRDLDAQIWRGNVILYWLARKRVLPRSCAASSRRFEGESETITEMEVPCRVVSSFLPSLPLTLSRGRKNTTLSDINGGAAATGRAANGRCSLQAPRSVPYVMEGNPTEISSCIGGRKLPCPIVATTEMTLSPAGMLASCLTYRPLSLSLCRRIGISNEKQTRIRWGFGRRDSPQDRNGICICMIWFGKQLPSAINDSGPGRKSSFANWTVRVRSLFMSKCGHGIHGLF